MDFERGREMRQFGEGRKKLLELEKEGNYVFHGSPDLIQKLEPRQAYGYNEETGQQEKDGKPAVFATPYADAAIFRSLINPRNIEGESDSKFGMRDDGKLHFSASQNLIDAAKLKTAKIYVLDKTGFSEPKGTDVRIEKPVTPLQVIEVSVEDLPDYITVIE